LTDRASHSGQPRHSEGDGKSVIKTEHAGRQTLGNLRPFPAKYNPRNEFHMMNKKDLEKFRRLDFSLQQNNGAEK
jgi:hypothetical protein